MRKLMVCLMVMAITVWGINQVIAENTVKSAGNKDAKQGVSKGDNKDDQNSGKIDWLGDGNSGQGDDKKSGSTNSTIPRAILSKYDRDGDGKLSDAEKAQWKADREARRTQGIKDYHQNNSGNQSKDDMEDDFRRGEPMSAKAIAKYDKNGDGELNAEELKQFRADRAVWLYNMKWDTNHDGKINPAERKAATKAEMLRKYDKDRDGKLNDTEMAQWKADQAAYKAEIIKKYDKNGDGKLNDAERAAMKADQEARRNEALNKFIQKWDKDGDGSLNQAELAAFMQSEHKVRRSEPAPARKYYKGSDGKIHEGGSAQTKPNSEAEQKVKRAAMLKKYDKDGDGKLNDAEKDAMKVDQAKQNSNKGVRDHGKGQGKDNQGQGKGQGKGPGSNK
ncbi:MAG: EF-hand domain-containing protein [Planctomycetota bacterium]